MIPQQFWCTWRGLEDGVDARQCCSYHCFHGISDEKRTLIKIRLDVPRQSQWHDKQGVSLSHKVRAMQRQEPKNIVSWLIFHGAMKIKLKVVKPFKMGQIYLLVNKNNKNILMQIFELLIWIVVTQWAFASKGIILGTFLSTKVKNRQNHLRGENEP